MVKMPPSIVSIIAEYVRVQLQQPQPAAAQAASTGSPQSYSRNTSRAVLTDSLYISLLDQ